MKNCVVILLCCFSFFQLFAEKYNLGTETNPAFAEVIREDDQLRIKCTFKAVTGFYSGRNAEINRRRADDFCQKALLLYLNTTKGQVVDLSGIAIDGIPARNGNTITYSFIVTSPTTRMAVLNGTEKVFVNSSDRITAAKKNKSSLTVVRYKTEKNQIRVVSSKVYHGTSFENQKEFDAFCQQEFDRINKIAEKMHQSIIDSYNQKRNEIINK